MYSMILNFMSLYFIGFSVFLNQQHALFIHIGENVNGCLKQEYFKL